MSASGTRISAATSSTGSLSEIIAGGCNTYSRLFCTTAYNAAGSGAEILTGFTARTSFQAGHLACVNLSPGSGITDAWMTLYHVDAAGNSTAIAQTANTPAPFMAAASLVNLPLLSPAAVVAGERYAVGILINYSGAYPYLLCTALLSGSITLINPYVAAYVIAATPPASIPVGSLTGFMEPFYFQITP